MLQMFTGKVGTKKLVEEMLVHDSILHINLQNMEASSLSIMFLHTISEVWQSTVIFENKNPCSCTNHKLVSANEVSKMNNYKICTHTIPPCEHVNIN